MKQIIIGAALALAGYLPAQVKQSRPAEAFDAIRVGSAIKVVLTISDKESLVFEAEEEVMEKLKAEVKNGVLHLYTEGNTSAKKDMIAYVSAKTIRVLDVSGAAEVKLTNALQGDRLVLETSGAGEVDLDLRVKTLEATINGAADVDLKGSADEMEIDLSGAADFDCADLAANNARLKASGASKASINVKGNLKVNAAGAAKVIYSGSPKNKDIFTSGAASVTQG